MNNKVKYVIIALVFFLVIGIVEMYFFSRPKKHVKGDSVNHYSVSSQKIKNSNLKVYTNEQLKETHCIDVICVENVTFYYENNRGKISYSIMNQSDKVVSGFVKLVFGEQYLIAPYENLKANQKIQTSSYFEGISISAKENYVLEKLTKAEEDKIVYINK